MTVYNYFAAKHDLVLDRAEKIRERYGQVVLDRPQGTSPPRTHYSQQRVRSAMASLEGNPSDEQRN